MNESCAGKDVEMIVTLISFVFVFEERELNVTEGLLITLPLALPHNLISLIDLLAQLYLLTLLPTLLTLLLFFPSLRYLPGSIVRVKLENFVTYSFTEFHPGPHLNMIIGPNGTGKSTIVCAIALGLGFPTKILGRAKDIASFVKKGHDEGYIEIELQARSGEQNPVIKRVLNRSDNSSAWFLNG